VLTSAFVLYGWLLFRAGSTDQVYALTSALTDWSLPLAWRAYATSLGLLIAPLLLVEVWQYRAGELLVPLRLSQWPRATLYAFLIFGIQMFWKPEGSPFIYFQF